VNLVPELELIIGKQPPVPNLPPQDAQNRFQLVFRRFLGVFARPEHPLALFLDDLQWLDAATLDLLEHLVTHSEVRHLLLVGAYRDNEVIPSHPLRLTLEAIRKAGAPVQEIVLAPLRLDDVGQLIADAMHCEPELVRALAQLVQEKTGGNPFFAIQFLMALAEEGLLALDLVARHREQLSEWSENYPPTFADKHTLVSAEIARLEGRDADAMRLYEQAIQSARDHGFLQNEGLAHELAAGFYLARGSTTAARAYLEDARTCFARWGALGKVQQLDRRYPRLREKTVASPPTATIGAPIEQLDVRTVVKASQAVSGEIELGKLIETLMRIAIEHAGAERGLLILLRGNTQQIEAEARFDRKTVEVTLQPAPVSPAALPESLLHTVIRTRQSVILDDALAQNPFSADEYIRQKQSGRSSAYPWLSRPS
jgi:hypothetical protein